MLDKIEQNNKRNPLKYILINIQFPSTIDPRKKETAFN